VLVDHPPLGGLHVRDALHRVLDVLELHRSGGTI
jgi:hypothetical protein